MRTMRNLSLGLLVLTWMFTHAPAARADDLGCNGEDGVGQTPTYGPVYCGGTEDCCQSAFLDDDWYETLTAFCNMYGEDPEYGQSGWDASVDSSVECDGFYIDCACIPRPR